MRSALERAVGGGFPPLVWRLGLRGAGNPHAPMEIASAAAANPHARVANTEDPCLEDPHARMEVAGAREAISELCT